MRLRFDIKGIDCPHCALTLEKMMGKLEHVLEAKITFALSLLVVDVDDSVDEDSLLQMLQNCADSFEDGISVDFRD